MDERLFDEVDIYLTVERKFRRMTDDRFLTDFTSAWRHAGDLPNVPPEQEAVYRRLEKKEQQRKDEVTAANCTINVDENGNITIRQGSSVIQVEASQRIAFAGALFSLPSRGVHPGGPSSAFPQGQTSAPTNIGGNHLENDDRPGMKERMQQNIDAMERWAKAQRYPQHT